MWVAGESGADRGSSQGDSRTQEKLDRALVAGLILEVVLDQPDLPVGGQDRQLLVKNRIQDRLVRRLAGRISLERFRHLAQNLDGWFDFYYPLLVSDDRPLAGQPKTVIYGVKEPQATFTVHEPKGDWLGLKASADPPATMPQACLDTLLDRWLEEAKTDMPHRSHRKLTPGKLRSFLHQSGGRWFRLRDFERFVQMDRKTAWDYLQQFLQSGLLCHNRKNSAAVRYCLAPAFLKVEADALRLAISLHLPLYPEDLIEKISDFLIATGGEPFHRKDWEREFPTSRGQSCLEELAAQDIIVWQTLPGGSRFFKLHHRWLHQEAL
jgi:hypothetical protein